MAAEVQKSGVWQHFVLNTQTQKTKRAAELSFKGGFTSSMWKHLASKHLQFNKNAGPLIHSKGPKKPVLKQNTLEVTVCHHSAYILNKPNISHRDYRTSRRSLDLKHMFTRHVREGS